MAEHNLIQRPDLLRRLALGLGLRQPHITPALDEGVKAVVIMEDFREFPGTQRPTVATGKTRQYVASCVGSAAAGNETVFSFIPNSGGQVPEGTTYRLIYLRVSMAPAAVGNGRIRIGWRTSNVGGAIAETFYPNVLEGGLQEIGPQWFAGSVVTGASGGNYFGEMTPPLGLAATVELGNPKIDLTLIAKPTSSTGIFVHADDTDSVGMSLFSVWEETKPG